MKKSRVVIASFLVSAVTIAGAAASCSSKGANGADANGDAYTPITATNDPLSQCAQGWQVEAPVPNYPSPCPCSVKATPECSQSDCQKISVFGLLPNGVEIDAVITYSAASSTMSTLSDVTRGQWSLADGGIFESSSGGKVAPATCDSAGGVMYIGSPYVPATTAMTAALNAASVQGNSWSAFYISQ